MGKLVEVQHNDVADFDAYNGVYKLTSGREVRARQVRFIPDNVIEVDFQASHRPLSAQVAQNAGSAALEQLTVG